MSAAAPVPKLEITGLSKVFRRDSKQVVALENVDLALAENEFVALVGTSGCGKSTLLSIAAGLQDFDTGAVLVDGEPILGPGRDRGVVFQSYRLLPWLTAQGNVEFALRAAGYRGAELRQRAREHLALVGLDRFADAYPNQLSGGMKQRVAIARGMAMEPDILLMDEPFAALDALTRGKMQEELLQLWEDTKFTVLFVTHSIPEAVRIGSRILLLSAHPGQVRAELNSAGEGSTRPDSTPLAQYIERLLFNEGEA